MDWYRLSAEEVAAKLGSTAEGLSAARAQALLAEHGPNELLVGGVRSPWKILFEQFTAFMVLTLIVAAVISAALGDLKDAIAIGVIVLLNALLGFSQEYRAEKAMAALKKMAVPHARVRRGGETIEISSSELVPGDLLYLEAGNLIPADCRLLESVHLQVQEAALTGESEPIRKVTEPIDTPELSLGDRRNMVYRGTFVSNGRGAALVTATGMGTELGRIATLLHTVEQEQTPLQKRLDVLGKRLAAIALAIVTAIFVQGILRGEDLKLMFLTAVSIGVAAIPEGLPAVVTIALTLGAQRMLKRKVLVRRLSAVESLGSITVICSDKTGTLTENRMTVATLYPEDSRFLLLGGALCNDAIIQPNGEVLGDPTETALATAAARQELDRARVEPVLPRVGEIPFDSSRKRMTTVHDRTGEAPMLPPALQSASRLAFTKGAVDGLLKLSTQVWSDGQAVPLDAARLAKLEQVHESMAGQGMRVLGVAFRTLAPGAEAVEAELTFIGMTGIIDPPRQEAAAAVAKCQSAGIQGVMITGDHPATAVHIAGQLGLAGNGSVIKGSELEGMSVDDLKQRANNATVYARVSPEHKLKIVDALQELGHIAAMTGDGVNDAPALKKADIGIAMGITGTDVAKEAADMVLLDDNFASIVAAVEEGRIIYDNVRKFIRYILGTNAGEICLMVAAPFAGMPLPLLPLQILWLNLVTDGLPALALGVEPAERNVMQKPPHPPSESVFARGLGVHVAWVGTLMGALCLGVGYWYWSQGNPHWQTILFSTLTFMQMAHVMAIRSEDQSLFTIGVFSNRYMVAAVTLTFVLQLALIYVPFLQSFFSTTALTGEELAVSIGLSLIIFIAVELEKWKSRRS
jgi:Ca2+-transporting ATPase